MTDATLAFLFADIEGCAQLWDRFPSALPAALQHYDGLLRDAIQGHGGRIFKMMGDACCAVFDAPGAAVAAALAGQRALLGAEWGEPGPLRVRMALHAGPAERRDDDYFGPSLNRVARILAAGHGGQLLLSQAFQQQLGAALPPSASLRDLGERRLRGLAEPERLFHMTSLPIEIVGSELLLQREPGSRTRAASEALMATAGVEPRAIIEMHTREAVREAVALGLGVGFFYSSECPPDPRIACRLIEGLRPDGELNGYVVCLADRRRTALIRAVMSACEDLRPLSPCPITPGMSRAAA